MGRPNLVGDTLIHRATRHRRRHKTAAQRVRKNAKHHKGARSQAKQISSLAGSVVQLQKTLREDTQATTRWQQKYEVHNLDADLGIGTEDSKGIFVFPLTSGPSKGDNAAASSISAGGIKDMAWTQVQPQVGDDSTASGERAGVPWIKLYRSHSKMCFYQNDMNRGNKFHLFVVRLAREDETQLDNTMLQRLTEIDGATFAGNPGVSTRFNTNEDYYSVHGFRGPTPTDPGGLDTYGYDLITMNNQRYVVEYQRQFSLGRSVGPVPSTDVIGPSSGGSSTQLARDYYECSWNINYGGAKLMANDDDAGTSKEPITIDDVKYSEIDPKLKRWLVILPLRKCSTSANTGVPRFSLLTTVTCKVPA